MSAAVLQATGSVLTNKYSEGYAGNRYYEGQQIIDQVERIAIDGAKALFGAEHARSNWPIQARRRTWQSIWPFLIPTTRSWEWRCPMAVTSPMAPR